jgi:hypothetical protein
VYGKAYIALTRRTLAKTLGQALAYTIASVRTLAQNTPDLIQERTVKTAIVLATKRISAITIKSQKKASLISLAITAESQATMLLAVLNQRSIKNDAQKPKFKLFSSTIQMLATVLALRLAPEPVPKNL